MPRAQLIGSAWGGGIAHSYSAPSHAGPVFRTGGFAGSCSGREREMAQHDFPEERQLERLADIVARPLLDGPEGARLVVDPADHDHHRLRTLPAQTAQGL